MIHWTKNRNVPFANLKRPKIIIADFKPITISLYFNSEEPCNSWLLYFINVIRSWNKRLNMTCMFECDGCHHCKELCCNDTHVVRGGSMLASTHSLGWGGIVELGGGFWRYRTVIRHTGHGLWGSRRIGVIFKVPRRPWNTQVPI